METLKPTVVYGVFLVRNDVVNDKGTKLDSVYNDMSEAVVMSHGLNMDLAENSKIRPDYCYEVRPIAVK